MKPVELLCIGRPWLAVVPVPDTCPLHTGQTQCGKGRGRSSLYLRARKGSVAELARELLLPAPRLICLTVPLLMVKGVNWQIRAVHRSP